MSAAAVVRLDLFTMRPYAKQLLVLLGVAGVIGAVNEEPLIAVALCVVYAALASTYPFSVGERYRLDSLHAVLPVRRSALVLGHYGTSVLLLLLGAVAGTALAVALGAATGHVPAPAHIGLMACASLATAGVAVAAQMPVLVRFGYARGRIVAFVPFGLLLAVGGVVAPRVRLDALPQAPVLAAALLLGTAAVLAVSAVLSVWLDAGRRD